MESEEGGLEAAGREGPPATRWAAKWADQNPRVAYMRDLTRELRELSFDDEEIDTLLAQESSPEPTSNLATHNSGTKGCRPLTLQPEGVRT